LDKKNQKELVELMNSLFEERTRAVRSYIYELMTEKQTDLQSLRQEYEPQRDFLRQKKHKELISEEEFNSLIERLNEDQNEREHDIELAFAEKEQSLMEEIEKSRVEAENE